MLRWVDRGLERMLEPDSEAITASLRTFELLLLVHVACERWAELISAWPAARGYYLAVTPLVTLGAAAGLLAAARPGWARLRRAGLAGVLAANLGALAYSFPMTGNHLYLEILLLLALLRFSPRDARVRAELLAALRFTLAIVFFYAGLQKLVHGYYLRGQFLAFAMHEQAHFRAVLQHLVSAADFDHVLALSVVPGSGPWRLSSPLALLLSNLAWAGEMGLAALYFSRRWRGPAVALSALFLVFTELMARELFFGALFANLLLLLLPPGRNRRFAPLMIALYAVVIALRLGFGREVVTF